MKKILEGSTLLDHELTEVLTVSLLGVEFLLPINDAVLDIVAILLDVLGDSSDVSGLLILPVMAIEVPEPLVLAVEEVLKQDESVNMGRPILVELSADHHAHIWLTSQLVLEERKRLLLALVELGVGEEPTLGLDSKFFAFSWLRLLDLSISILITIIKISVLSSEIMETSIKSCIRFAVASSDWVLANLASSSG